MATTTRPPLSSVTQRPASGAPSGARSRIALPPASLPAPPASAARALVASGASRLRAASWRAERASGSPRAHQAAAARTCSGSDADSDQRRQPVCAGPCARNRGTQVGADRGLGVGEGARERRRLTVGEAGRGQEIGGGEGAGATRGEERRRSLDDGAVHKRFADVRDGEPARQGALQVGGGRQEGRIEGRAVGGGHAGLQRVPERLQLGRIACCSCGASPQRALPTSGATVRHRCGTVRARPRTAPRNHRRPADPPAPEQARGHRARRPVGRRRRGRGDRHRRDRRRRRRHSADRRAPEARQRPAVVRRPAAPPPRGPAQEPLPDPPDVPAPRSPPARRPRCFRAPRLLSSRCPWPGDRRLLPAGPPPARRSTESRGPPRCRAPRRPRGLREAGLAWPPRGPAGRGGRRPARRWQAGSRSRRAPRSACRASSSTGRFRESLTSVGSAAAAPMAGEPSASTAAVRNSIVCSEAMRTSAGTARGSRRAPSVRSGSQPDQPVDVVQALEQRHRRQPGRFGGVGVLAGQALDARARLPGAPRGCPRPGQPG